MRAALVLLLLVPTATALDVTFSSDTMRVTPFADPAKQEVEVTFPCGAPWETPVGDQHYEVIYTATAPGLVVSGPSTLVLDPTPCLQQREVVAQFPITVASDLQPLGEAPHRIILTFRPDDGGSEKFDFQVIPAFVGNFTMEVINKHVQVEPQKQAHYELELVNHGNTVMVIDFAREEGASAGDFILPDQVVLEAPGQPGATKTVQAIYAGAFENGSNNERDSFVLTATSSSVRDQTEGQSHSVDLTAHTKGFYVPGPALPLLGLALLAIARRR